MRRGFTLIESVMVLTLAGVLLAILGPRLGKRLDRLAVTASVQEAAVFYGAARFGAIMRGSRVRIEFGADSLLAFYETDRDSLFLRRDGPVKNGVALSASRPVIWILPNGLGSGGANTKLVFRRGEAADSLTTSRLGRLKH
jgi:prepilin-type N-terminal cleavage/methylation domain-containing protein